MLQLWAVWVRPRTVKMLYQLMCVCVVAIEHEAGERPRIQSAGSETVVQAGHDVQFTCEASGTPTPFILWYRNDTVLDQRLPRFLVFLTVGLSAVCVSCFILSFPVAAVYWLPPPKRLCFCQTLSVCLSICVSAR